MIFSELIPKKSIFLWNTPNYKKIKSSPPQFDFFIAGKQNQDSLRFRYASRSGILETAFLKDFLHVVNLFLARL